MDEELYLGIPGVDAPYPKYVQDALDLVEKETRELDGRPYNPVTGRFYEFSPEIYGPTTRELRQLEKFWITRRKQKEVIQKKRPYQPYDRADQWPLF